MQTVLSVFMILSTTAMLSLQACNRKPLPEVPVTENVTFDEHIRPITSTVCIKCHSSGSRDYSQYKNAFSMRYSIRQRVVVDKTMPLGQYLSEKDRALFRDWVDQGGKR